MDLIVTSVYAFLGVILMIVGNMMVDLIIPGKFPEEIKKGNMAIGCIMAAISISVGIIFKSAVMSPSSETVKLSLIQDLGVVSIYFILGMLICMVGYLMILFFYRKLELNEEILKGNMAAGLVVAGLFIGLATIISGAIA
ncbi:DUF350 domain-containing protein [Terrisporobacter sp.]|uniref:DUF350 domain-containing protein n=1 Tax=Terrisporobacter sp. TaxID=1965305 RepID=UPI002619A54A|nr:DUF350 domain-containing protein [Terrisporobacter sp.]